MNSYALKKNTCYLYCLFLLMTTFCEYHLSIGGNFLKYTQLFLLMFFAFFGFGKATYTQGFWSIFFIAIFSNWISSYIFRGQDFVISYFAYYQIWFLLFFFVLVISKSNLYATEKLLQWVILTVTIVYYIQLLSFPKVIWGNAGEEWIVNNELYFRGLVVGGESAVSLGYFYFFNKYLLNRENKFLLLLILCAVPFFVRGYRIMIMGCLISTLIMYIRAQKKVVPLKIIIKIFLVLFLLWGLVLFLYNFVPMVQGSLDSLLDRSGESNQTFDNDDYIRILSINYYYTSFFKSPFEMFFGAGMIGENGPVAETFAKLLLYNYNLTDWGLIGLSWYAGMPVVLCIIFYLIRGFLLKVPRQYLYISAWFLYLLIISLTDPEMYQHYSFLIQSILLYMLYKINPHFFNFICK